MHLPHEQTRVRGLSKHTHAHRAEIIQTTQGVALGKSGTVEFNTSRARAWIETQCLHRKQATHAHGYVHSQTTPARTRGYEQLAKSGARGLCVCPTRATFFCAGGQIPRGSVSWGSGQRRGGQGWAEKSELGRCAHSQAPAQTDEKRTEEKMTEEKR